MSKCIVTGGYGFIGSHVVEHLIKEGHHVLVIDNSSTGTVDNLKHIESGNLALVDTDITFASEVNRVFARYKPDYVFHLASLARIQPSINRPYEAHDTNVNGTFNVINACLASNVKKLVFSSTSSLYYDQPVPSKEQSQLSYKSPYSLHKLIAEQYIGLYASLFGLRATVLRYFNVFGERQILKGEYAAVVGIFLNQYKNKQPLTIVGDGKQKRDYTYVKDVAKANLMALDPKWDNQVVNIGTGKNYSINDLVNEFPKAKTDNLPKRPGETDETLADIKLAQSLGWKPTVDIKDWIKEQL